MPPSESDLKIFANRLDLHFQEMTKLLVSKRRSYGADNLVRFGGLGIVIRASDKIDRLSQMYQRGEYASADGDSMEDAWRDLIGYGVLGLIHHLDEQEERREERLKNHEVKYTPKPKDKKQNPEKVTDFGHWHVEEDGE